MKKATTSKSWNLILPLLFLAGLMFAARYWHLGEFGLYEDDLTIIPRAALMTGSELIDFISNYIVNLYGHGRPLSDSMIYLFSFIAWRIGGIKIAYLIGYLIVTLNVCLFYLLLRRLHSRAFALLGGLAYVLFAADTTQAFLTHSLGLHPSITLLLLALHSYLSGKKVLSYILAAVILFSYETPFPVFFAAPLLAFDWDKKLLKKLIIHAAILIGLLGGVFFLRSVIGEGRVSGMGLREILLTPILHMAQGPFVSLGTYLYRPVQAVRNVNLEVLLAVGLSFPVFFLILSKIRLVEIPKLQESLGHLKNKAYNRLPEKLRALLKLLISGSVMLILAYPLTFTVRAYAISGRDTRVHFAAVVGASIVLAAVLTLFLSYLKTHWKKTPAVLLVALLFSLLFGYGFVIQRDYRLAWDHQQQFWTDLLPIIQDAGDGTVVLVEPDGLGYTRQIDGNTWNLPRILNQIYHFPEGWEAPPRVYRLSDTWEEALAYDGSNLSLDGASTVAPPSLYQVVDSRNVIFIETHTGELVRRIDPLSLNGNTYPLKQPPDEIVAPLSAYEKGFLHSYLVDY